MRTDGFSSAPLPLFDTLGEWSSFNPGLERITQVLSVLGNPQHLFPHWVVGGTNGKGTVSYNLARAMGPRCGLFLSPHVVDLRERISLAGEWFPDEAWQRAYSSICACFGAPPALSYFEWLLVLAVVMFAEAEVAHAIFEVGMGGREDAVNVLSPELSLVTNVGLDHQTYLGNSLTSIALHKIAIGRKGLPLILPESVAQLPEVDHELRRMGCLVYKHRVPSGYKHNLALVNEVLWLLDRAPLSQLLALPCRREALSHNIWLDGAHNENAWSDLADWLRPMNQAIPTLVGLSGGRDPLAFLAVMMPVTSAVSVMQEPFANALPESAWPESLSRVPLDTQNSLFRGPLLVCGSLYAAAAFRRWWFSTKLSQ